MRRIEVAEALAVRQHVEHGLGSGVEHVLVGGGGGVVRTVVEALAEGIDGRDEETAAGGEIDGNLGSVVPGGAGVDDAAEFADGGVWAAEVDVAGGG